MMVDAFIKALSPTRSVTDCIQAKKTLLRSVNSKLSQCLQLSFKNTLSPKTFEAIKINTQQVNNNNSISTFESEFAIRTPASQCLSNRIAYSTISNTVSTTSSESTIASPARTRKNRNNSNTNYTSTGQSPRNRSKAKLQRTSEGAIDTIELTSEDSRATIDSVSLNTPNANISTAQSWNHHIKHGFGFQGRPTTDFLGWRRLHLHEVVRLNEGDFFIIVVPSTQRNEETDIKTARNNYKGRVLDAVIRSRLDIFSDDDNTKQKRKRCALEYLEKNNGVERNSGTHIELPCLLKTYTKRDDYLGTFGASLDERDIIRNVNNGEGMYCELLDFQNMNTTLLKWSEINSVQIFIPHFRGDFRPQVSLSVRKDIHLYCDEVEEKFNVVKDNYIQMLELSLAVEKEKSRVLTNQLRCARSNATDATNNLDNRDKTKDYKDSINSELEDQRLQNFGYNTNLLYIDAWKKHYSRGIHKHQRLLDTSTAERIHRSIEQTFPLHYQVFRSLIFPQQSHTPSRMKKQSYQDKKKSLVNHFLALIRVRWPRYLVHWGIVGTMAMFHKGMNLKIYRNPVLKAFSVGVRTAFKHLDEIHAATTEPRMENLKRQAIANHGSDNYQEYHTVATQRENMTGFYHTGMVYNLVRMKEFNKPIGTVICNVDGSEFVVLSSILVDSWTCRVVVRTKMVGPVKEDDHFTILLPCVGWRIKWMPGESPQPAAIVYVGQEVPPSLYMLKPVGLLDREFVLGNRQWIGIQSNVDEVEKYTPREHVARLEATQRLLEIVRHNNLLEKERALPSLAATSDARAEIEMNRIETSYVAINKLFSEKPNMVDNIENYQRDSIRSWNETCDAVDEYYWPAICPREEMSTDEALLAMVNIFEGLGMIEKAEDGNYVLASSACDRLLFQYGDVLTIKKWHSLEYYILRKMTTIGKEDYVTMMMKVYKRFVKLQDYLHENIHRLQGIFKLFYGGFIQPVQVLLGTRKLRFDPTKASWKDAENETIKLLFGLQRARMDNSDDG